MIGPRGTTWNPAWEAVDRVVERVAAIEAQHGNCMITVDERDVMRAFGLGIIVRSILRRAGFDNPSTRFWARGEGEEIDLVEFTSCEQITSMTSAAGELSPRRK